MAVESWKREFDSKYRRLMNMGSISVIDKANEVLLKAIEGLDAIQKQVDTEGKYNLKRK